MLSLLHVDKPQPFVRTLYPVISDQVRYTRD